MLKRLFDIIFSTLGLLILSSLFLLVAILIKLDSRGPVFFRQERVGKDEKIFKIYKFRTMIDKAWEKGTPITTQENDPRITHIGKFLRKYKLDELPQLFNVIKGEMSLVGPRPEIPQYVALYTPEQKKILSVKPGITDFASLEYINENEILSKAKNWEKTYINEIMPTKLALNLKYIKNHSVFLDFIIILKTLKICSYCQNRE
jgi:lipopolysaccharide/colanic/teichoic acid biosynthesis glycosyltransferase